MGEGLVPTLLRDVVRVEGAMWCSRGLRFRVREGCLHFNSSLVLGYG